MTDLTETQTRLLRFWGANMSIAFETSAWWPGFSYTEPEQARLRALADTIPRGAMALWLFVLVPAIFIVMAAASILGLMLPFVTLMYPNPADLKPLPFILVMASCILVTIGVGFPIAMSLGGRLALRWAGGGRANPHVAEPEDGALYAKFRRQLWRVVLVMCGLFIPGCWIWIIYDIHAGPIITVLKWACGVVMVASGFGLWSARRG